jgi:hypothetical protein
MPTTTRVKTRERRSTKKTHRRKPGEPRKRPYSSCSLSNEAWAAWLETYLTIDEKEQGSRRFDGKRVLGSDARSLHRWLHEEAAPSLWTADAWCVRYGLHVDAYFKFCSSQDCEPWQLGQPPRFETEELDERSWQEIQRKWPLPPELEDWPSRSGWPPSHARQLKLESRAQDASVYVV